MLATRPTAVILFQTSLRPGCFKQGQPERVATRMGTCCAPAAASTPAHRDRWLLFAGQGSRVTVTTRAQRAYLVRCKSDLQSVFLCEPVCFSVLGVQGADLNSKKGNSENRSVCCTFISFPSWIQLLSVLSGCMWRLRNLTTFTDIHIDKEPLSSALSLTQHK